jgi:hypothetical protein
MYEEPSDMASPIRISLPVLDRGTARHRFGDPRPRPLFPPAREQLIVRSIGSPAHQAVHVDHSDIVKGEFTTGQDVTRACLECHKDAATRCDGNHPLDLGIEGIRCPLADEPVTIGKANQINNFCISAQGNQKDA